MRMRRGMCLQVEVQKEKVRAVPFVYFLFYSGMVNFHLQQQVLSVISG